MPPKQKPKKPKDKDKDTPTTPTTPQKNPTPTPILVPGPGGNQGGATTGPGTTSFPTGTPISATKSVSDQDACCPTAQKIEGIPELIKLAAAQLEVLEAIVLQNKKMDANMDMVGAAISGKSAAELEAMSDTYGRGARFQAPEVDVKSRPEPSKKSTQKESLRLDKRLIEKVVLEELQGLLYEIAASGDANERSAHLAANRTFPRGKCKGMTAKEAMRAGCKPAPCDEYTEEEASEIEGCS